MSLRVDHACQLKPGPESLKNGFHLPRGASASQPALTSARAVVTRRDRPWREAGFGVETRPP